jgi:hypothetical protein
MKTIKLFLAASIILVSTITKANTEPSLNQKIRTEILKLLSENEWDKSSSFMMTFVVNPDGDIVVSKTTSAEYDGKIKSILNYKKIKLSDKLNKTEIFTVPIRIVESKSK